MSLAGKPPFATDEPDSFYDSKPKVRHQPPPYPTKRSSAYDVYDTYLDDKATNRQSGAGALGMGLLNMDSDDDDDEDDKHTPTSKHKTLAVATSPSNSPRTPPPQYIAAPRPGYVTPISALNLARPEPAAFPQDRKLQQLPPALRVGENPFEPVSKNPFDALQPPRSPYHHMPSSPAPSMTEPHPLQPPITPITPVFARPAAVSFEDPAVPRPRKHIMRSDNEGTLLPNRGEKGDDFWRRFSMVVKDKGAQKESSWLKETQSGTSKLSRWVWVIGLSLLLAIGGVIGLAWYVSHNSPSHQQPQAVGGSANESAVSSSSVPRATGASTGAAASTVLHVQPTFTVARRVALPTGLPEGKGVGVGAEAVRRHKKRLHLH